MTPKQQVLQRYPGAYCVKLGRILYAVMQFKALSCRKCLAMGANGTAAWRAAAKAVAKEGK